MLIQGLTYPHIKLHPIIFVGYELKLFEPVSFLIVYWLSV